MNEIEQLRAAVAALTAERDAAGFERDIARKARFAAESDRDAARSERDASNLKREEQWKELQAARAALGQAHAVIEAARNLVNHSTPMAPGRSQARGECIAALEAYDADPEGRAAAEYVAALEGLLQHTVGIHPLPWGIERDWGYDVIAADGVRVACFPDGTADVLIKAAHDAVEALRTVKP